MLFGSLFIQHVSAQTVGDYEFRVFADDGTEITGTINDPLFFESLTYVTRYDDPVAEEIYYSEISYIELENLLLDPNQESLVEFCTGVVAISTSTVDGNVVGIEVVDTTIGGPKVCDGWFPVKCTIKNCSIFVGKNNRKLLYSGKCGWDPFFGHLKWYCSCIKTAKIK